MTWAAIVQYNIYKAGALWHTVPVYITDQTLTDKSMWKSCGYMY